MAQISNAVNDEAIARTIGYIIKKGNFSNVTPNLPQRIALLAEANTANQGGLTIAVKEATTAQAAGVTYGYGSPIHMNMRILRPSNGGGVGSIPIFIYPQLEAGSAVAAGRDITITGATATASGTHTVVIGGRKGVDGGRYDFSVVLADTNAEVLAKITDVVNNVLSSPVTAVVNASKVDLTAKWAGLTSQDLTVTVDTNNLDLGLTYAVTSIAAGAETPTIAASLALFDENWNTIVINSYGEVVNTALETYNGIPDPENPTGRFAGQIMKPFIALYGDISTDPSTNTDARKIQVTNAACPAPNSPAFAFEAAANMAVLFARTAQDTPHLDVNAKTYPDMPAPTDGVIGSMSSYTFRDSIVKKGSSTVTLIGGRYAVQDFITTYHPDGETPPQFRYCRNLMLDFNIRFGYYLLEQINVVDHVIANDEDIVNVTKFVKPKMWKQIVSKYAEDLGKRGLIADVAFMQNSINVGLSVSNPDRLETAFSYKRTGTVRIAATTATAGFNFGTL
jgi:phage tail sheath gpL-like